VKHAGASHVQVRIASPADNPAMLVLEVADDGIGFDPATTAPGLGLVSMRERAERLGAQLVVTGGDGGGTVVRLVAPGVLAGAG
jgi:signal transduction histidine kinase